MKILKLGNAILLVLACAAPGNLVIHAPYSKNDVLHTDRLLLKELQ